MFGCSISESPLDFFFLITSLSSFHEKLSSEVTGVSNWTDRVENHYSLHARTIMLALDHFDTVMRLLDHKEVGTGTSHDDFSISSM